MGRIESRDRAGAPRRRLLRYGLNALLAGVLLLSGPASGWEPDEPDPALRVKKVFWQNRYRSLLEESARLQGEIERERELYADANRRNYRRGKKRHVHREAMQRAAVELADVEQRLARFEDEARADGALPGWLYEVEAEWADAARRPSIAAGPEDDGRNPLYRDLDDEDEPAER